MHRSDSSLPVPDAAATVREQAVYWITQERLGILSATQSQLRDQWLAADIEHRRVYDAVLTSVQLSDTVRADDLRGLLHQANATARRRKMVFGGAGLCTAALFGAAALHFYAPLAVQTQGYVTALGERKRIVLSEGTVLDLNTDTRIQVALGEQVREVIIDQGEVLFAVSHDAVRPFVVKAGEATVKVTGTRFDVRLNQAVTTVAVEEGSVQVSVGPWWNTRRHAMQAGMVFQYQDGRPVQSPTRGNVAAVTAWQRGRLVFSDASLQEVVDELNRYLQVPVRIADPSLQGLRIAGTLPIDQSDAVLDVLPRIAPVRVVRDRGDSILLLAP